MSSFDQQVAISKAHSDIISRIGKDLLVSDAQAAQALIDLAIMLLVMLPQPADVTAAEARFNEAILMLRSDANVMELSRSVRGMWEAGK